MNAELKSTIKNTGFKGIISPLINQPSHLSSHHSYHPCHPTIKNTGFKGIPPNLFVHDPITHTADMPYQHSITLSINPTYQPTLSTPLSLESIILPLLPIILSSSMYLSLHHPTTIPPLTINRHQDGGRPSDQPSLIPVSTSTQPIIIPINPLSSPNHLYLTITSHTINRHQDGGRAPGRRQNYRLPLWLERRHGRQ